MATEMLKLEVIKERFSVDPEVATSKDVVDSLLAREVNRWLTSPNPWTCSEAIFLFVMFRMLSYFLMISITVCK